MLRKAEDSKQDLGKDVKVEDDTVKEDSEEERPLRYNISDTPPFYLTIFFAIQQCLLVITYSIVIPLYVAEAACALEDGVLVRKLVSSAFMLSGMTTFVQVMFGVRLPVYQGPTSAYAVPIIALNRIDESRCDVNAMFPGVLNSTSNMTETYLKEQLIDIRLREMMGPLILAGGIHCLIGATGLVGMLLRYIGPVTIVPTLLLLGLYVAKPAMYYTSTHWGVSLLTWAIGIVLSMYLGHKPMIIPVWTRKKGFHIIRYPLHQVFSVLIAILIGWTVCGIMTAAGAFTTDKSNIQYKARTDARIEVFTESDWFYVPYPGQFGSPLFSISALIGYLIATIISILDSIGDYYAAAAICRVPPPPNHAVNRGIAVEGFCTLVSGLFGAGHATTTSGSNIGAIGITKVASRRVIVTMAVIYMILGVLAKVSAALIMIPYPVLGGIIMTVIGVFVGLTLSNLKVIDLSSSRNMSIIGTAVFVGLLIPSWIEKNGNTIDTGNADLDRVIRTLLGNPNFLGGVIAFFMDNTIPGTEKERGITAWREPEQDNSGNFVEGLDVYEPLLPACLKRQKCLRLLPVFPNYNTKNESENGKYDEGFYQDSQGQYDTKF